ncbi:hypothetical protein Vadar_024349 [Vaccinium darrowii]|uniref:Uncharacterized protein n=1 Tax=Vaccinium darrowii TaxID=229202 RepID=A0ACB7YXW2_9ERIC|nr:hypothetical protein Vadar_024349 [Vaccinium darrowii]
MTENQSSINSKTKKKKTDDQFEFCKVCRLNHDQGRRHKYFPNHVKSLSSFLSRFQQKLSDVKFFLKNPAPLRPEHAARNRLWCAFCDSDFDELGSSFACGNAINHLASADHLKNLKNFLWKHGGGMDQVDSFRISEADLAKWEKKCTSLKSEATRDGSHRPLIGPSNGMRDASSCLPAGSQFHSNPWGLQHLTGYMDSQQSFVTNGGNCHGNVYTGNGGVGGMYQAHPVETMVNRESSSQGLHNLTQISGIVQDAKGNVHSGAPPPWFDVNEENLRKGKSKQGFGSSNLASSLKKSGKSQKLNPKRVGAAWAEKRKIELEMEKRGEIATDNFDVNWLPNFGRVWQSGTRKESRKEFQVENKNSQQGETQSETSIEIQPYVSKRKRTEVE